MSRFDDKTAEQIINLTDDLMHTVVSHSMEDDAALAACMGLVVGMYKLFIDNGSDRLPLRHFIFDCLASGFNLADETFPGMRIGNK